MGVERIGVLMLKFDIPLEFTFVQKQSLINFFNSIQFSVQSLLDFIKKFSNIDRHFDR